MRFFGVKFWCKVVFGFYLKPKGFLGGFHFSIIPVT